MAKPEVKTNEAANVCDLRDWLDSVEGWDNWNESPAPTGTWRSGR